MAIVSSGLQRWKRLFLFALVSWCLVLLIVISGQLLALQKNSDQKLPFGFFALPHVGIFAQDFSYNILFLKGIDEHRVARPYRMEDQEQMVRQLVPPIRAGMTHAYSPVALVLVQPLLHVSGFHAYLIYLILTAAGILLLFYFWLLPRMTDPWPLAASAICLLSVCTVTALEVGQSAMLTTVGIGAFWALLSFRLRAASRRIWIDLALALIFWALCVKPSVAIVPFFLLLGAQAWRPLLLGLVLLLATWSALAGYYGGWWTGLQDYSYLLNHYHNAAFTPFMQRANETSFEKNITLALFSFDRISLLVSGTVLVLLRWTGRITLSELFQLTVWMFLLFSPYLLPSEDWILCLLFVEGSFFKGGHLVGSFGKLILLACIFNLRTNAGLPEVVNFPCKLVLVTWLVIELIRSRKAGTSPVISD